MRIAIVGAGFPALIMARTLADVGYEVHVFGDTAKAGVLSGMGPRHLWVNRHTEFLGDQSTQYVRWTANLHTRIRSAGLGPTHEELRVLSQKTGKDYAPDKLPCRGVQQYQYIVKGFTHLLDWCNEAEFVSHPGNLSQVSGATHAYLLRHESGEFHGPFERCITTVPPFVFQSLVEGDWRLHVIPTFGNVVYAQSQRPPQRDAGRNTIYYSGIRNTYWYRASWNGTAWCYESSRLPRRDDESIWGLYEQRRAPTQMQVAWNARYPGRILPVGRNAEWDSELLVSDVFAMRHLYTEQVYSG